MKKIACISLLLSVIANAQYTIDWANTPLNPNPVEYTQNHLNLLGDVSVRSSAVATYHFDKSGKVTQLDFRQLTNYNYNDKGFLKSKIGPQETIYYECDEKGRIIKSENKNGEQLRYTYNDKDLLTEVQDLKSGNLVNSYSYDSSDRIISNESYKNGILSKTTTYSYGKNGSNLVVKSTEKKIGKSTYHSIDEYDSRGYRIVINNVPQINTYDSRHNILKTSNEMVPLNYDYIYYSTLPK